MLQSRQLISTKNCIPIYTNTGLSNINIYYKFDSKGSKSGASTKCAGCQGSGMKVSIRQLGPSMIQQMQHPCNECKGTGETINDKDRCTQCKGEKVVQEKKVLEVIVEKGMQNGQKITFPGEADEAVCFPFFVKLFL